MEVRDIIGSRGESIFYVLITKFYGRNMPLFRPQFLGDKFESVDFLVELTGAKKLKPFFFVQVKSTTQGYIESKHDKTRLRVQVSSRDIERMKLLPAPTYIAGIHERLEVGYFVSANNDCPSRISSISTDYPINNQNMELLWEEVNNYWQSRNNQFVSSSFIDKEK